MKGIKILLYISSLFLSHLLHSQKVVRKTILDPHSSFVQLEVTNCYELILGTSGTSEMIVEATMDGEYSKDLMVVTKEEGNTFFVNAGFRPNFMEPNDKLGAHKVISISLRVQLPYNMEAKVYGTNCNVTASGHYRRLEIVLGSGRCLLQEVGEDIMVRTQSGDIWAKMQRGTIAANTKYGNIFKGDIPKGNDQFKLQTVTGNIHLQKTK